MVESYLIDSEGPDEEAIIKAYSLSLYLVKELNYSKNIILYVPALDNLTGIIQDIFGVEFIKSLKEKKVIPLKSGAKLILRTQRTFGERFSKDIILAIHPTKKMIDTLNDLKNAYAIILVPWLKEEVQEWISVWSPKIIDGKNQKPDALVINPGVEMALKSLTERINLLSGLSHPSDKYSAIQLIEALYQNQINFNPKNLKIWALKNNWTSDGAIKLFEIAQNILSGKKLKSGKFKVWSNKFLQEIINKAKAV